VYLHSTLFVVHHTQDAQARITQCYLQLHQCLPLPRKHSPDGASPDLSSTFVYAAKTSIGRRRRRKLRLRTSNCGLLLIYLPRKDKRLTRHGWVTYSGRFTHKWSPICCRSSTGRAGVKCICASVCPVHASEKCV